MARRSSRGGGRSVRRGPKNQVWTNIVMDENNVLATTTAVLGIIVGDSDWAVSGSSSERATILRVRGWLSLRQETVVGVGSPGTLFLAIHLTDEDATVPDFSSPGTYAEEDVLWTGGVLLPSLGDATARSFNFNWMIDIKAMRKLRTGQTLNLVVTNGSGGTVDFSGVVRALVRRGGN